MKHIHESRRRKILYNTQCDSLIKHNEAERRSSQVGRHLNAPPGRTLHPAVWSERVPVGQKRHTEPHTHAHRQQTVRGRRCWKTHLWSQRQVPPFCLIRLKKKTPATAATSRLCCLFGDEDSSDGHQKRSRAFSFSVRRKRRSHVLVLSQLLE